LIALAVEVARTLKPIGRKARPGGSETRLTKHQQQIRAWLAPPDGSRGLRLTKAHELLARLGVEVPYSSLHRFAVQYCGFHERNAYQIVIDGESFRKRQRPGEHAARPPRDGPRRRRTSRSWRARA
jgi:hypothetical protein